MPYINHRPPFTAKQIESFEREAQKAFSTVRRYADVGAEARLNAAEFLLGQLRHAAYIATDPDATDEVRQQVANRLWNLFRAERPVGGSE